MKNRTLIALATTTLFQTQSSFAHDKNDKDSSFPSPISSPLPSRVPSGYAWWNEEDSTSSDGDISTSSDDDSYTIEHVTTPPQTNHASKKTKREDSNSEDERPLKIQRTNNTNNQIGQSIPQAPVYQHLPQVVVPSVQMIHGYPMSYPMMPHPMIGFQPIFNMGIPLTPFTPAFTQQFQPTFPMFSYNCLPFGVPHGMPIVGYPTFASTALAAQDTPPPTWEQKAEACPKPLQFDLTFNEYYETLLGGHNLNLDLMTLILDFVVRDDPFTDNFKPKPQAINDVFFQDIVSLASTNKATRFFIRNYFTGKNLFLNFACKVNVSDNASNIKFTNALMPLYFSEGGIFENISGLYILLTKHVQNFELSFLPRSLERLEIDGRPIPGVRDNKRLIKDFIAALGVGLLRQDKLQDLSIHGMKLNYYQATKELANILKESCNHLTNLYLDDNNITHDALPNLLSLSGTIESPKLQNLKSFSLRGNPLGRGAFNNLGVNRLRLLKSLEEFNLSGITPPSKHGGKLDFTDASIFTDFPALKRLLLPASVNPESVKSLKNHYKQGRSQENSQVNDKSEDDQISDELDVIVDDQE